MSGTQHTELFWRHPHNPIISTKDLAYKANSVFNAGATKIGNETLLLMRVEDRRGISHLTVARSKDGVHDWKIDDHPTLLPNSDLHPEEIWGIEDPRITYLEEKKLWAVTYTAFSQVGPLVSLATTTDFKNFERQGPIMAPENKDAALFPIRFGNRWAMIHRPVATHASMGAHLWLSFSPDLKHWGDHHILMYARRGGWWDSNKIGLSPPPLRTDEGWLILYHGIRATAGGCIYRLGLALLDIENPSHIIARGDEWVFSPQEEYEIFGDVDKVVFPCGWTLENDEIRIYYGGADTSLSLATAKLSEVLAWLKKYSLDTDSIR